MFAQFQWKKPSKHIMHRLFQDVNYLPEFIGNIYLTYSTKMDQHLIFFYHKSLFFCSTRPINIIIFIYLFIFA